MKPTQFLHSASGISERIAEFTAHLRHHGFLVGSRETARLLQALEHTTICDSRHVYLAGQCIYPSAREQFQDYEDLFNAFWFNTQRTRQRLETSSSRSGPEQKLPFTAGMDPSSGTDEHGNPHSVDSQRTTDADKDNPAEQVHNTDGKLIGSQVTNRQAVDLREFMQPDALEEAQRIARRLAMKLRDQRSRRWARHKRGSLLDHRRIIRRSISQGGEPIELFRRKHPDRARRITALLDVSGSMMVYSRVFLAFLQGLISEDSHTDAFLFHTSLVKVSDDLREPDTQKAINRLSLKARGFGGGSRIGHTLERFNRDYARRCVNGRTVVMILSDGYDTDPPERLAEALRKLKKRGCKIVWLNPLKGWKEYQPIASGMAAALPYLDLFAAANTLDSLASLDQQLARL